MARAPEWQRDIREAIRREHWSLVGPNRVVKVVPLAWAPRSVQGGYIIVGKVLVGKTPLQIERALGVKPGSLARGARIYRFVRLPQSSECEYELTTLYPGGLAFNPAHSHPDYPPGSPVIHQWKIKDSVLIPVDPVNFLDLLPSQKFPYEWLL